MTVSPGFHPVAVTPKTIWLFVSLTDGARTGWGEATLAGQEDAVANGFAALPQTLDAAFLDHLSFATLADAALSSALLQAHADLVAQQEGRALCDHLGGTEQTTIGLYANINRRTVDRSPQAMADSACHALAAGHTAIKIAPFDEVQPNQTRRDMTHAMRAGLDRIAAVRGAIGWRRLMVDCHWRFDQTGAEVMIDACAPFALHWIECPIAETPDAIPVLKELRARANATDTRLAGLETEILRGGFAPYIAAGAYDVMMPDVKYCGGPFEMLAIAGDMARAGVVFSPHNPSGPICHAHSLHICAALPEADLLETQYDETPNFDALVDHCLAKPEAGQVAWPLAAPGLGLSLVALDGGGRS